MGPTVSVGLVGIGTMGSSFARHLVERGFAVVGHDPQPAGAALLEELGQLAVDDVGSVAAADPAVIVLSLPSDAAFEQVVGELCAASTTAVVADTSTLTLGAKGAG